MKVHTLFTTRRDGDIRKKTMKDAVAAEQVHGNTIAVVSLKDAGSVIPSVDGLVSRDPVCLVVHVADCVPILAWDEDASVVGAAHAGWKGTMGHIAGNLITAMQKEGADAKKIHVSIGPHIGMCCYDVSGERAERFLQEFGTAKVASFFENAWHVDIGWANYSELMRVGILPEHISAPIVCTSCQVDRYFSYRKDSNDTFGEQMGAVWIGKR